MHADVFWGDRSKCHSPKTGFQQTRATQPLRSSLVNGEFNRSCLQKEERVRGFLEEVGQLTDCYTTKEKPVLTSAIVNHFYVLREERDRMHVPPHECSSYFLMPTGHKGPVGQGLMLVIITTLIHTITAMPTPRGQAANHLSLSSRPLSPHANLTVLDMPHPPSPVIGDPFPMDSVNLHSSVTDNSVPRPTTTVYL